MNFSKLVRTALLVFGLPALAFGQQFSPQIQFFTERGAPGLATFAPGAEPGFYEKTDVLRAVLNLQPGDELRLEKTETDALGFIHEKYRQWHRGVRLEHATVSVHAQNGLLKSVSGNFCPLKNMDVQPGLPERQAFGKALQFIGAEEYMWQIPSEGVAEPTGELVIVEDFRGGTSAMRLAWKFDIYAHQPISRDFVFVDAQTGAILLKDAIIKHANAPGTAATRYSGIRTITTDEQANGTFRLREAPRGSGQGVETYDMNKGTNYGNAVDFVDDNNNWTDAEWNNADKDNAALDAHWGAEMTYDYFSQKHNRNSYDNAGSKLKSYVHFSTNYDNAFWDGSRMTYGDGGALFSPLTCMDVCAHEIGHGVCQFTCNLVYANEPGALNESLSDIWGACVEKFADPNKQTWLIGEEIVLSGNALRYMSNPNLANDPDTYLGAFWYYGAGDNGGVHTNSGVFNFFFYLLSQGGTGTNDLNQAYTVTGIGTDDAAKIVYRAESIYMTSTTNYPQVRPLLIQAATDLFGGSAQQTISVHNAMHAVGIGDPFGACPQVGDPLAYNITPSGASINWQPAVGGSNYRLEYKAGNGSSWTVIPGLTSTNYVITGLQANTIYDCRLKTFCTNGDSSVYVNRKFTTQQNGACPEQYELNNTLATAAPFPLNETKTALIQTNLDLDYYTFTLTTAQAITVTMTTLPADYDIKLLSNTGSQLAVSENGGTTNETITYAATAGTYKLFIYGWNGAASVNTCYTLKVTAPAQSNCNDVFEPNNTQATATNLTSGSAVDASIGSASDVDWFKITVAAPSNLTAALTSLPANYDLELFNAAGTSLAVSQNGGTTNENIAFTATTPGDYFLKINGVGGAFDISDCYNLLATATPIPVCNDPFEPNNTQATAAPLAFGTPIDAGIGSASDVDWFKITVAAPSNLTAALTSLPANYDLELFNAAGTSLAVSQNGGTTNENIAFTATVPGDYFLKINGVGGVFDISDCYNLLATATPIPICNDVFEPNETQATAAMLTSGSAIDAGIGSASDVDWFKITVAAPSNLTAALTSLPANFDLELFNAAGTSLAVSQNGGTASENISFPATAPGDYFLKINGVGGAFDISDCYNLLATVTAIPCSDPFEPNNNLTNAALLTLGTPIDAAIGTATDADWFKVAVTAPATLSAALTSLPHNYDLRLYSASSALLALSVNTGTADENILFNVLSSGTYYLKITTVGGLFSTSDCYNLLVSATPITLCSDPFEPNNSQAAAAPLAFGTPIDAGITSTTDADWFKISPTSAGTLAASLTSLPANYDLRLYNAAGTQVAISKNLGTADENLSYTATAPGDFFLKISGVSGANSATDCYALLATFTPACTDVWEPNNSLSAAAPLPLDSNIQANLNTTADKDYFKFGNSAATPNIRVTLSDLPSNYDLKLYRNSTLLGASTQAGTANETIVYNTSVVNANHRVYVYRGAGGVASLSCYTLRVELSAAPFFAPFADDREEQEPSLAEGLQIFPNPASERVQIILPGDPDAPAPTQFFIVDALGRVVQNLQADAAPSLALSVDVAGFAPGVYLVRAVQNGVWSSGKFVVQHGR